MITNSYMIGFAVGHIWAFFILNLDRLLVGSMSKQESNYWLVLVPRLALATVIALVISTPLVVLIFHDEIDMELMEEHNAKIDTMLKAVAEVDYGNADKLTNTYNLCTDARDELYQEYLWECDGTGGSRTPRCGPIATEKYKAYSIKADECKEIEQPSTEANNKRQAEVTRRQEEMGTLYKGSSLTTRHRILWQLAMNDLGISIPYFCITAILWLIEVLPVSAKLNMLINGQLVTYETAMGSIRKEKERAIREWFAEKEAEHTLTEEISRKLYEMYKGVCDTTLKDPSILTSIKEHTEKIIGSAIKHVANSLFERFTSSLKSTPEEHGAPSSTITPKFPELKKWTQRAFAIGIAVFVVSIALSIQENPGSLGSWGAIQVVASALFALFELILLVIDKRRVGVI